MRRALTLFVAAVAALALAVPAATAKPDWAAAAKPGDTDLVSVASGAGLTSLVAAVELSDGTCGTDFAEVLTGGGQYTVFAPTNAAFTPVFAALGGLSEAQLCELLPDVLAYHVTTGRHHSRSVLGSDGFRMLNGGWAPVDATAGTIAGASIVATDVSASNGIAHVIDAVIFPPAS